ncbi:transferase family-domain-containing protein [Lenzites betulinus]|nr:transferase family-domain-containing protein [Lenzites betulinus]
MPSDYKCPVKQDAPVGGDACCGVGVPAVELISRTRILPEDHASAGTRTTPLSILDNTAVRFSLVNACWYYDKPKCQENTLSPFTLVYSLRKTLNVYPQWAGQLEWMKSDPARGKRLGRLCISYGSPSDPGIELVLARCTSTIAALVPDSETRLKSGAWCADHFSSSQVLFPTDIALHDSPAYAGRPAVSVQLTTFSCGGISIALRIAHVLADATSLFQFIQDWAAMHRALLNGCPLPTPIPVFDPGLVDSACIEEKNIDCTPVREEKLIHAAQGLSPNLRNGRTSTDDAVVPSSVFRRADSTRVPSMPWAEWNIFAPASHYHVCFTPAELQGIWEAANAEVLPDARISRLDALLAFIWRLIVRARGKATDPGPDRLVVAIGVRARLVPRLPDAFLGSPMLLSCITLPAIQVAESPGAAAGAIRAAVAQYTAEAIGAFLGFARDANPQRFWRGFLGQRYTVVTSWVGLGGYKLDFGGGPPRYVDPVIPGLDGCIHVMEAGPSRNDEGGGHKARGSAKKWYHEPVCLSVHLDKRVMRRLLKDPELRKYRSE